MLSPDDNPEPQITPSAPAPQTVNTKLGKLFPDNKLFGIFKLGFAMPLSSRIGPGIEADVRFVSGKNQVKFSLIADVGFPNKRQYPIGAVHYQALYRRTLIEQPISDDQISTKIDFLAGFRFGRSPPFRHVETLRKRPMEFAGFEIATNLGGVPTHLSLDNLKIVNLNAGISKISFTPHAFLDGAPGIANRIEIVGLQIRNTNCTSAEKNCGIATFGAFYDSQKGGGLPNNSEWGASVQPNWGGVQLFFTKHRELVPHFAQRWIK